MAYSHTSSNQLDHNSVCKYECAKRSLRTKPPTKVNCVARAFPLSSVRNNRALLSTFLQNYLFLHLHLYAMHNGGHGQHGRMRWLTVHQYRAIPCVYKHQQSPRHFRSNSLHMHDHFCSAPRPSEPIHLCANG